MARPGEGIYRRVSLRMHADEKVRKLTRPEPCGLALWHELIFGPQTGIIPGLFVIGEAGFAEQLGWSLRGFRDAWSELLEAGLAVKADWPARLVWVRNAIRHDAPRNPNQVIHWRYAWEQLPECALKDEAEQFLEQFLEQLGEQFLEQFRRIKGGGCRNRSLNGSRNSTGNQEAVSSKQEAGGVDRSKDGESEGKDITGCEQVGNSSLDALSPSDRAQVQQLFEGGKASEATVLLASINARASIQKNSGGEHG